MGSKREYRSRIAIDGLDRTPHRAFLRACGLDDQIGVVSTHGENTPCSMSLAPQADAARLGVAAGGGRPVSFTTISVSDGLSMNHKGMRLSLF
jgi:dihydroxy-acid dehydratase